MAKTEKDIGFYAGFVGEKPVASVTCYSTLTLYVSTVFF